MFPFVSLYSLTLVAHSYFRWAVLAAAGVVIARTWAASGDAEWTDRDESAHKALLGIADTQVALGFTLWAWLSPISGAFFADAPHAVHDHVLRFFGIEHVTMMVVAIAVLHAGRVWSKKAPAPPLRRRRARLSVVAFTVLVLSSIPWPGLRHGRPLFRVPLSAARPIADAPVCPPLYEQRCAMCHGARGRADGIAAASLRPPPRNFTDAKWQAATSDVRIHDVIHDGGIAHGLSAAMPAGPDLTPPDVAALTACIRSFAGK